MFDFSVLVNPHLGARSTKESVMQWFTMAWWRWRLAQARGRNPLVRPSDRAEVAVMALAVIVSLAVIPFAGAIGTAVHDGHAQRYAAQEHDRHLVKGTATADSKSSPHGPVAAVQARWRAGDVESAGILANDLPVKDGSSVDIWVDNNGRQVSPPAASWQAGADAVVAAAGFWLVVTAVAALLVALVRRGLRRARYAGWSREMASLVHDDGGRTNRRR
ncbi:MAG TPA: hypothetical protein VL634_15865 [Mycobacterium sp.]|nr:hypothetical protein [Mycobacterium sp.]